MFYIVCNKYYEKLGFFVLKINPFNPSEVSFYVKWKNKLDINDCTIAILRDKESGLKELILSFKIIYINMYSLFAVDISVEETDESIIFRHESFQVWESQSAGMLLNNKSRDFIHINNKGISVMSLASKHMDVPDKRCLIDNLGDQRMLHSLESCNFLKLDPQNYIHMDCTNPDEYEMYIR